MTLFISQSCINSVLLFQTDVIEELKADLAREKEQMEKLKDQLQQKDFEIMTVSTTAHSEISLLMDTV